MFFEIDNTPEHIRRPRCTENVPKEAPKEECPRLILAPFARPPHVVFDNVVIGTSCERNLEVLNPLKCVQQVTLARSLPHGLQIHLPRDGLKFEPEICYCLTMSWTPTNSTALRETIHFTNEKRGRYDVIVVLKPAVALFRDHVDRTISAMQNPRAAALRTRWRDVTLRSKQAALKKRYDDAMEVLNNFTDMKAVILTFRSLEFISEVNPEMLNEAAHTVVVRVYGYMNAMNRSISNVEALKSAASLLANLARDRATGPNIYAREHIPPLLTFMWRFSTSEEQLFLILSTYLWLFAKYDAVREDLTEYLHTPENHKMMLRIKSNVSRVKRMTLNASKRKPVTPANFSNGTGNSVPTPALEPDYGVAKFHQQRYFVNTQQAINCLFRTYNF